MNIRVGQGFDAHRFTQEKKNIWLGGVEIPHDQGLEGHSDADALTHSICDALLGALALGDIGSHFSDTDPQYKNKNSLFFLEKVLSLVTNKGWTVSNIDSTVITEKPMLRPYIEKIQESLSKTCNLEKDQVSIKATRPEKMGALGRHEGLVTLANVLIYKK